MPMISSVRAQFTQFSLRTGISPLALLIWGAAFLVLLLWGSHAFAANPFDAPLAVPGKTACGWVIGLSNNILVRVFFFGMAVIGFIMGLARARGGWVLCGVGAVAGILVLQTRALATSLGILPQGC